MVVVVDSMESRLKKSHRLIRLVSDIKSAPYLTVEQLLVSHGISRAQFYKDKSALRELGFEFFWDRHRRVVLSYRKSSANQPQREDLDPYHPFF
jgi:predicted DNA-binding transcriptional regulator YafY